MGHGKRYITFGGGYWCADCPFTIRRDPSTSKVQSKRPICGTIHWVRTTGVLSGPVLIPLFGSLGIVTGI